MDCLNIVIAVVCSIVATIIWVVFSSLYIIGGRKKNDILIEYSLDTIYLLNNALEYRYYSIALSQVEKLIELLLEINSNIAFFNYRQENRKLIYTFLFHSIRTLSYFKTLEIGYEGDEELAERCSKMKRKYLFDINYKNIREDGISKINSMELLLSTIKQLNKLSILNNISVALNEKTLFPFASQEEKKKIFLNNLIDVNSFKSKGGLNYYMRGKAFTKEKYNKVIEDCFNKKMN